MLQMLQIGAILAGRRFVKTMTPVAEAQIEALPAEEQALRAVDQMTEPGAALAIVDERTGKRTPLPQSALRALHAVSRVLAAGQSVVVLEGQKDLTPNDAAEILNVSRPFVRSLIEKGELEAHAVGTHHRIPLHAVLAYKQGRSERRRESLRKIGKLSKEMGLYDQP